MTRLVRPARVAGVTLIELAIVIALVGILSVLAVQFVAPVRSYIDTSRRAALADTADTALRRVGRDLRLALPNSVRVTNAGSVFYLELLLVRTGGRYRADTDSGATSTCTGGYTKDVLAFSSADTCFKTIGNIANIAQVTTSDYVVVFNLQPGTDKADAYQTSCGAACNKSQISAATPLTGEDRIEFASNTFTYESPGNRFFIIEGAVSYVCDPSAGTLTRRWGYTIAPAQPTTFTDGSSALMASSVSACTFTYDANVSAGTGLATLAMTLSTQDSSGTTESAGLYHAVHVNNVP
jgi:MSHA biogenesis protein MshO